MVKARRLELGLLAAILLLACTLRLGWPGLTEFKRDEALLLARALDVASFQQFHLRGISSSVGWPNFPMSVWLYALPLLIWKHVYSATLFTGLVNVLAVLGCWWLARRYWGAPAGLAAALLFAASPWAIFHARKIWAQDLLPPLVVGWGIGAALAFIEGRRRFILLHLLCLAAAVQTHLAAVSLIPATAVFLLVFRRRVAWRLVAVGVALALFLAVPFLIYLHSAGLLTSALAAGAGQRLEFHLGWEAWRYLWLLSSGREIHALAGPEQFEAYLALAPRRPGAYLLWEALMVAGVAWLAWLLFRAKGQRSRG
ncbi:MAG: glycosyltransferase family 39 protein, partial [Chloroflexi bacterium]|nr:glycosyltransferase family 39 protein [Chloroflexota bacterium]